MTRNGCFQMLTILALVAAIVFVAHNFVKYVLKGKCVYTLSLRLVFGIAYLINWVEYVVGSGSCMEDFYPVTRVLKQTPSKYKLDPEPVDK